MSLYRVLTGAVGFAAAPAGAVAAGVVAAAPGTLAAAGVLEPAVPVTPGSVGGVSLMPRGKRLSLMLRSVLPPAAAAEFAFCSAAAGLTLPVVFVVRPLVVLTSPLTGVAPSAVLSVPPVSTAPSWSGVGVAMPRAISDWLAV